MTKEFNEWVDIFFDEKGIDLEDQFTLTDKEGVQHLMSYGVVVEHMKITTDEEKASIKNTIVHLDFMNDDIGHFLRYLAQVLIDRRVDNNG